MTTNKNESIKDRALREYQEVKAVAAEAHRLYLDNRRREIEKDLLAKLEGVLGITEGIQVVYRGDDSAGIDAVLRELPGIKFYLYRESAYQMTLKAAPILPDVPDTPEYADWYENSANQAVQRLSRDITCWADLGELIQHLEDHGPIVIQPWPPEEDAVPPAAVANNPGPFDIAQGHAALLARLNSGEWEYVAMIQASTGYDDAVYLIRRKDAGKPAGKPKSDGFVGWLAAGKPDDYLE